MSDFPTLSTPPVYPLKQSRDGDQFIKSKTEAGYVITRSRYSRARLKFNVSYQNISAADKALLETLIDEVDGEIGYFTWTHPITSVSYTVRFDKTPEIEAVGHDGSSYYYNTSFDLVEV